jgi:5-methylcytosine-specific restriction endonuclease McrA
MRNLRNRYNYTQRTEFQSTISSLAEYIRPLLLDRQGGVCNVCKVAHDKYDMDHLRYNPMETINDLQLLCIPCHKAKTDYRHISKQ